MTARKIALALSGQRAKRLADGSYVVPCPVASHDKGRGDRNPSLRIGDGLHATAENRVRAAATREDAEHLDRVAQLLFDVVVAEAKFHRAGHDFLDAASGIDRGIIVRHAAKCLCQRMTNTPSLAMAETAIWRDLEHIFGWVAELPAGGCA
jgi:hypothetical protein